MNSSPEIISIISEILREKDISQSELARRVGMAKSAISRYFSGTRDFPVNRIGDFAEALGVTPEYLLGIDLTSIKNISVNQVEPVPVLGTIAAGVPTFAEENIEDYLWLDKSLFVDFSLKVKGDSMKDADIQDGEIALFRKQSTVDNGDIAAVVIEDEATLKQVYYTDDKMILKPANEKYAPIIVSEEQPAYIIGKLIGTVKLK